MRILLWTLVLFVAMASACAITPKTYTRDGKTYGAVKGAFRGRWYNYYERALSYLDGGYFADAIADLNRALALRDRDQRRARTYGLHFIDYFPNRELGIAQLGAGDIDAALEALAVSLGHVDSGRAEYFMNVARREQMLAKGVKDVTAPGFDFSGLSGSVQRQRGFRVAGKIQDPSLVAEATVNGKVVLIPVAAEEVSVDVELALAAGPNEIVIEAWDLFGNRGEYRATVTVDADPPTLAVNDLREEPGFVFISGVVQDATGVSVLRANGEPQSVVGTDRTALEFEIPVQSDRVVLEAEDGAGNTARIEIAVADLRERLAQGDTDGPRIELGELPSTVYEDRFFLDGSVWDRTRVAALTIGGEPVGSAGQKTVYFRKAIPLAVGLNEVLIEAIDDTGAATQRVVEIVRKLAPLDDVENRLSVAMAPFVGRDPESGGTGAVEQNLENALVEQRRFHIIDRSRVSALVTEWQLVATNLAEDGPDLLKLGKSLATDATMLGWVEENGDSIEVYARLVDSETGTILLEKDVFHEKKSLRNVRDLLAGLGLKFKVALPRLEGIIASRADEALRVTMTDGALLPAGARLLILGEAARENTLRQIVGEARIRGPVDDGVTATVLAGDAAAAMTVVTK